MIKNLLSRLFSREVPEARSVYELLDQMGRISDELDSRSVNLELQADELTDQIEDLQDRRNVVEEEAHAAFHYAMRIRDNI